MVCSVQIRAGKPFAVDDAGTVIRSLAEFDRFIAGDKVKIETENVCLFQRKPQYTIGIVKGFVAGSVQIVFPFHPYFKTTLIVHTRVSIGDRLVVFLNQSGGIIFVSCFPNNARQDLACTLALYNLLHCDVEFDPGIPVGISHYTSEYKDLSHLGTFTVDPVDSRDLDDAVSIDPVSQRLYVHIVDIHNGIPHGSLIEECMFRYGATLYLSEKTSHLLSDELVGELSLNKGVERHAITVEMTINMSGEISAYEIYPSTIVVKERYSYEEFAGLANTLPFSWLQSFAEKHKETLPLAIPGLVLTVDESGCLTDLNAVHSNDVAHRMISCAMIAANFTVSAHLAKKGILLPNRFHEAPIGLFQSDIEAVTHNPVVDSFLAVKKWRPARYDLHASGHFGLGIPSYVHFTSPMRRYPDVLVHRILAGVQYSFESLTQKIDAINDRAITVRGLQKYYTSVKIARYLESGQHLRSVYITGVSRAGVQWYSPDYLINGFCHVSKIGKGARWDFDGSSLHSNGVHLRVGELLNVESVAYDFSSCKYEIICE